MIIKDTCPVRGLGTKSGTCITGWTPLEIIMNIFDSMSPKIKEEGKGC
jgi:hypothetical protein